MKNDRQRTFLLITIPIPPAVNNAITACCSEHWPASSTERTVPGIIPQEPAVGAATIFPIAALHSDVARARAMA